MIAVDTNILARFYVEDPGDLEAVRQRPLARRVIADSKSLFVPITVVLELEWVVRAFYRFGPHDFAAVVEHLSGLPHVQLESREEVLQAIDLHRDGLDFADALHLARTAHCVQFVTFDERRFARRVQHLTELPAVVVPR